MGGQGGRRGQKAADRGNRSLRSSVSSRKKQARRAHQGSTSPAVPSRRGSTLAPRAPLWPDPLRNSSNLDIHLNRSHDESPHNGPGRHGGEALFPTWSIDWRVLKPFHDRRRARIVPGRAGAGSEPITSPFRRFLSRERPRPNQAGSILPIREDRLFLRVGGFRIRPDQSAAWIGCGDLGWGWDGTNLGRDCAHIDYSGGRRRKSRLGNPAPGDANRPANGRGSLLRLSANVGGFAVDSGLSCRTSRLW